MTINVQFRGLAQQQVFEQWLRTFPQASLDKMRPIANHALVESRGTFQHDRLSMARPHIREATALNDDIYIKTFNDYAVDMNRRRREAAEAGNIPLVEWLDETLRDLSHVVLKVLEISP